MGKSLKEWCAERGVNVENHREKYTAVVEAIGLARLVMFIPATKEEIKDALENGEGHLNEIPLAKWDRGAVFGMPFSSTLAERVCTLKQAARMWVEGSDGQGQA
jgi:hypothetical protein